MRRFSNRQHAGQQLAACFRARVAAEGAAQLPRAAPSLVLALPRGGVPVALEVARIFDAPLDVWVARKLGVPGQPELGMGAVAEGEGAFCNETVTRTLEIPPELFEQVLERERAEVARRAARYREGSPPPEIEGKTVWLIDDGIATGGTVLAAVDALRARGPAELVVGIPVAPAASLSRLAELVDDVVCVHTPVSLWSVGGFYDDFRQVSDEEVLRALHQARRPTPHRPHAAPPDAAAPDAPPPALL